MFCAWLVTNIVGIFDRTTYPSRNGYVCGQHHHFGKKTLTFLGIGLNNKLTFRRSRGLKMRSYSGACSKNIGHKNCRKNRERRR